MFIKRKKVVKSIIDTNLEEICDKFLIYNDDTTFAISKKFKLDSSNNVCEEYKGLPIIVSSKPVKELIVPSAYKLHSNRKLSNWYDKEILAEIIHAEMNFQDGTKIERLYLDMDQKIIDTAKQYKK